MRFEKIWCWKLRRRLWRDTIWKNCKNLTTWPKMIGSRGNDPKVTPYALSALGAANFLAGASLVSHPRDLPVLCKVAAEGDEDDPLAPFWAMTRSLRESWQLVLFRRRRQLLERSWLLLSQSDTFCNCSTRLPLPDRTRRAFWAKDGGSWDGEHHCPKWDDRWFRNCELIRPDISCAGAGAVKIRYINCIKLRHREVKWIDMNRIVPTTDATARLKIGQYQIHWFAFPKNSGIFFRQAHFKWRIWKLQ